MAQQAAPPEGNFTFSVFSPEQRKGSKFSYWVYKIRARINLPEYSQKNVEVHRRYSDFEWLREQLAEEFIHCIIPPIPEKEISGTIEKIVGSAHDPKVLEYRQRAFRRFLMRVGAHPELHSSKLLREFLEMDESEWERRMKHTKKNPATSKSLTAQFVEGVTSRFLTAGLATSTSAPAGGGYSHAIEEKSTPPQVWEDTKVYINQLEQSIVTLRARLMQLVSRRRDTSTALHDFGRSFHRVGEIEEGIEKGFLSSTLMSVANHSEDLSKMYVDQAENETKQVIESLTYYVGMCGAVREALQRILSFISYRDAAFHHVEDLDQQRSRLIEKGQTDKLAKVDADLLAAKANRDTVEKELVEREKRFKNELRSFHRDKQYDIKTILKSFTELQLGYSTKMKESWEKLVPNIQQAPKT